jgi:hypothetical protein
LAGDIDHLGRADDRDDVRIGGLALLHADVHARRLDPVDLYSHGYLTSQMFNRSRGFRQVPGSRRLQSANEASHELLGD